MENRAGEDRENVTPWPKDNANKCQTSTRSVATRSARAISVAKFDASLNSRMCLRLNRSAITPPKTEKKREGNREAALTTVTHRSD